MKHIIISVLLLHTFAYLYCSEYVFSPALYNAIVDEKKEPKPALLELLKETNCTHNFTIVSIAVATQSWLRPTGTERWEIKDNSIRMNNRLSHLFAELCLLQKVKPLHSSYDYAVFFGGSLADVRNRLAYLIELYNRGIQCKCLIVLTGARQLDTILENRASLLHNNRQDLPSKQGLHYKGILPTTEPEMIKFVFQQTYIPNRLHNIPCVFIDTPPQISANGSSIRPNTQDTIAYWLKKCNPYPGSVLAISNQPFVGYQNAVLRNSMPKKFSIETVGNEYLDNQSVANILDSLARWIYNENNIIHTQQAKY